MLKYTLKYSIRLAVACMVIFTTTACNGILDDIYDQPDKEIVAAKGQLVVDATSWTDWHYFDLKKLQRLAESGDEEGLQKAQMEPETYPIPMTLTKESDGKSGQYMYWFDVFGEGITKSEFREFTPCDPQEEPEEWTIAIHRNNVRTNGGAVLRTNCKSMAELPESSKTFDGMTFTEDEWSENDVWDGQEKMLLGLVPSQGIKINRLLSSWLIVKVPPMPPEFSMDSRVFVLRLNDGTYAALQLNNYLSPQGEKCFMTINYEYPY